MTGWLALCLVAVYLTSLIFDYKLLKHLFYLDIISLMAHALKASWQFSYVVWVYMHWLVHHVLLNFFFYAWHFDLIMIFACFACATFDTSIHDFTAWFFYLIELLLGFYDLDVTGIGTVFWIIIVYIIHLVWFFEA